MRITRLSPCCVAFLTFISPPSWAQHTIEFANPNPITINSPRFPQDDGSVVPLVATPYPSTIYASGFGDDEAIERVTVTLHDLSHGTPDDIDILLVGPDGRNIVLVSDAGGGFVDPEATVTLTLDDGASEYLPDDDPIVSGTYRPSNFELDDDEDVDVFPDQDEDGLPTPTPAPSSATALSIFAGTHPNGAWRLYVVDDEVFDAGSIAKGWSMTIASAPRFPLFRRGDASADGAVNLTDAVMILDALFLGGPQPDCADAADTDDDGAVSLTDAVYALDYLFLSGSEPPAPGPGACGVDPTDDDLPCGSFPPCRSACPVGLPYCNGVCTDLAFDTQNCGACGVICPEGTTCSGGLCQPVEPCWDCGGL